MVSTLCDGFNGLPFTLLLSSGRFLTLKVPPNQLQADPILKTGHWLFTAHEALNLMSHLTLVMLNISMYNIPPRFYPVNLQHSSYKHVPSLRVENSLDPDQ